MKHIPLLLALLPLVAPLRAAESGTPVTPQPAPAIPSAPPIPPAASIPPSPPIPSPPPALRPADSEPRVIPQLDTSGSTLQDVVKHLREATSANIVLPNTLADLPVPDLRLANVTALGVLNSLETMLPQIDVHPVVDDSGGLIINILPAKANTAAKVCRVFKASAKEKLQGEALEQLIKNLAEAARMVCEANARAQGRPNTELPTIEAHPPTGILIVTGEESDVQVLGQVVQALGGEVIPLTDPKPMLLNLPNGTTGFMNLGKGFSGDLSRGMNGMTLNVSPQIEQAQKQVEQARDQAGKAVKQMEDALKQITIQVKPAEKK